MDKRLTAENSKVGKVDVSVCAVIGVIDGCEGAGLEDGHDTGRDKLTTTLTVANFSTLNAKY